jgi:NAD(P)-dependent dehydrogenase (short-subunit alcohol dehydrogenase family)
MQQLDGKVCVITGAASGIGRAMAHRFREAGMRLALADIEADPLASVVSELGGADAGVVGFDCDVREPASVEALRDGALERLGGAHVVCLNAGVAPIAPLVDTTAATWRWLVDVNVLGVAHGITAFGRLLAEQGEGHVVCTASAAGLITSPALGAYSATKHAVVGMAAVLRAELESSGVGVSVVCPGTINTRIFESERNRPAELPDEDHPAPDVAGQYQAAVAGSVGPEVVAAAVHDAVVANRFFVLPSPELDYLIQARIDEVQAAMAEQHG